VLQEMAFQPLNVANETFFDSTKIELFRRKKTTTDDGRRTSMKNL
jgi:hypothetical protein